MCYSNQAQSKTYAPPILIAIAKAAVSRDLVLLLPKCGRGIARSPIALKRTGATRIPTIWRLFLARLATIGGLEVDDPPILFCDTTSLNLPRSSRLSRFRFTKVVI
jgi:hypothetical protein